MKVLLWTTGVVLLLTTSGSGVVGTPVRSTSASSVPEVGTSTAFQTDVGYRAFCTPEGDWGKTTEGDSVFCLRDGIDTKPRWVRP